MGQAIGADRAYLLTDAGIDAGEVVAPASREGDRESRRRGRYLIFLGAFLFAAIAWIGFGTSTAQADDLEISFDCWDPHSTSVGFCGAGSPDVRVSDPITFHGDISGCGFIDGGCTDVGSSPWQLQVRLNGPTTGPSIVTANTNQSNGQASVTANAGYSAVGAYQPEIRLCNTGGTTCTGWDKHDNVGINVDLDVGPNQAPDGDMACWSPNAGGIGCSGTPDGRPSTNFTFTVENISDPEGDQIAAEWDFDDNGSVDARTPDSGYTSAGSLQEVYAYGTTIVTEPRVRIIDDHGGVGGWDKKDNAACLPDFECDMDVEISAPEVSMNCWSPNAGGLGCEGSPDGSSFTTFTLSADFNDTDTGLGGQVVAAQWNFGDGNISGEIPVGPAGNGTAQVTHQYANGTYEPEVRVKDNDGAWSGWDKKNDALCLPDLQCDLDVADPYLDVDMECWNPADSTLGFCGAGPHDVRSGSQITLNGDVQECGDWTGVTCGISYEQLPIDIDGGYTVEWRLNGPASPSTASDATTGLGSKSHVFANGYSDLGAFQPEVRICDAGGGNCSDWDKHDNVGVNVDLDVFGPEADMNAWDPCFGVYPACVGGSPDANTSDVTTFYADYDDPSGVDVDRLEFDVEGNGSVEYSVSVSGTSGDDISQQHQYGSAGVYNPQVRAVGVDGAVGPWDEFDVLGIDLDYDVLAAQVRARMRCWDPADSTLGFCGAGPEDVRVANQVTLNADIDDCSSLCVGNYFTPSDVTDYDIHWRLNDGLGTEVIESTSGSDQSVDEVFAAGYPSVGVYNPEVRLCDDAATSTNCSDWDQHDNVGVNVDLDVYGPDATMNAWDPCFGVYPACVGGAPDANTTDTTTFYADWEDSDGFGVDLQWDFDGDGSVDATTAGLGSSGDDESIQHQFSVAGVYNPQVRAVATDGAVGFWDEFDVLGIDLDYDVAAAQVRARMQCWDPADSTLGFCGAGPNDVRSNQSITLNADIDDCSALCVGNYFTPADAADYDIHWRLNDGLGTEVIESGAGSDYSVDEVFPSGIAVSGAYNPEVRLCDDAATSTNCSDWDEHDNVGVNVDLDVYGPEATMNCWDPHAGVIGIDCGVGAPDAGPSQTITFDADYEDPDGIAVASVEVDTNGDGTPDQTVSVTGTSGNAQTTDVLPVGVYEPQARAVGSDGAVGLWDKYNNALCLPDFECDLDVEIIPPDAEVTFTPQTVGFGEDGDTSTNFYFDASDSTDSDGTIDEYRWDFNGDGTIDRTTTAPDTNMTYSDPFPGFPSGFGEGEFDATVTVVDNDGGTDTDQVTDFVTRLIPVSVDVGSACVGDQDGDGVPCDFDPDDGTYYREKLISVNGGGVVLTNIGLDAAALRANMRNRNLGLFGEHFLGTMNFVNADIVGGQTLRDTVIGFLPNKAIGSGPNAAYVRGAGICLRTNPDSFFGVDFGFCNWEIGVIEDNALLGSEDSFKIRARFGGNTISYDGYTTPVVSGPIAVEVDDS